jgi:hypothetical protein
MDEPVLCRQIVSVAKLFNRECLNNLHPQAPVAHLLTHEIQVFGPGRYRYRLFLVWQLPIAIAIPIPIANGSVVSVFSEGAIGSASQKRQRRDAAQPRAKTAERSEPWVGARKGKALKGRSRLLPRPCRAFWIFHCQPRVSAAAQPPPWAVLPRAFSAWHFDSHFQLHPFSEEFWIINPQGW